MLAGQSSQSRAEPSRSLQLEVFINDNTTKLVGAFTLLPDGRFAATRAELGEVGLKAPGSDAADEQIVIDDLPGVTYRYDEPAQQIFFTVTDAQRVTRSYDAHAGAEFVAPTRNDYGAVVNYTLFGASSKQLDKAGSVFSGGNASLDARFFSPYGTLTQTGIVGTTVTKGFDTLRLDTAWVYSDPETIRTYRAGDVITGSLAWTRPIRIGGVQVQRNFALRPDLVTLPLPSVSGSAAVPSTVDVYVNSLKVHSQDVGSGPYQVTNLPVLTGANTARVVVHDASGRTVETSLPFYSSSKMLKDGLMDFSLEAGFPRLQYGTESNSYVDKPVASAGVRRGMLDWLTLEAHGEGGAGLINGGIGAMASVGPWATVSIAGAASRFEKDVGVQAYAALDTQLWGLSLHASTQRTFGAYNDLASVTTRYLPLPTAGSSDISSNMYRGLFSRSFLPPKFLDTISVGMPAPFVEGSIGLGFLHLGAADGKRNDILNASYSRPLPWNASLYVSGFVDFHDRKSLGVFAGLSIPLTPSIAASTGLSHSRDGNNATVDVSKTMKPEPGSYGWRLHDSEGQSVYRLASGAYRSSMAQFDGSVWQDRAGLGGSAQVQGSVAAMGGGVFLSNTIDDAFAVVDAGAPNVNILYENRPAGTTNAQGKALVPTLKSYQKNNIAIDPNGLPVDADIATTQTVVTPAERSGVVVRFGVKTVISSAVVVLTDKKGKFLPAGSTGRLDGADETFLVGYDGRAYVKGLTETNTVVVAARDGECRASFAFTPQQDSQLVVGPVSCQ